MKRKLHLVFLSLSFIMVLSIIKANANNYNFRVIDFHIVNDTLNYNDTLEITFKIHNKGNPYCSSNLDYNDSIKIDLRVQSYSGGPYSQPIEVIHPYISSPLHIPINDTSDAIPLKVIFHTPPQPAGKYGITFFFISIPNANIICSDTLAPHLNSGMLFYVSNANVSIGIEEMNNETDIQIYPNPATDWLKINAGSFQVDDVRIYNANGQVLKEAIQPAHNNVEIAQLNSGIYIAEVKLRDRVTRLRWIKM